MESLVKENQLYKKRNLIYSYSIKDGLNGNILMDGLDIPLTSLYVRYSNSKIQNGIKTIKGLENDPQFYAVTEEDAEYLIEV